MSQQKKNKGKVQKNKKQTFWTQRNIIIIAVVLIAITASYFLFFRKTSNEPKWVKEGEVTFLSKDSRQHLAKIEVEAASTPLSVCRD